MARAKQTAAEAPSPDGRSARLAVLIDADNASPKIADGLFEIEILGHRRPTRINVELPFDPNGGKMRG